jgi:Predicted glutathione S-transferase
VASNAHACSVRNLTRRQQRELLVAQETCKLILRRSRYIAGDELTEADVRLFVTLIRFDEVYVVYL